MADFKPFLISGFSSGLEQDKAAWLLPLDAFQTLKNAYLQHGIIKKRGGMQLFAEMVHYETFATNISNANPGVVTVDSITNLPEGTEIQISYAVGGTFDTLNGGKYIVTNANIPAKTFELYDTDGNTVDTSALGVFTSASICLFPELPIMGIKQFVSDQNTKQTLVWDTRRMAIFNTTTKALDPLGTANIFTGDNTNFISVGYYGVTTAFATPTVFFTNYNGSPDSVTDSMYSFTAAATSPSVFHPQTSTVGAGSYVKTAKFIFSLAERLLLINTVENLNGGGDTYFPQRVRWSVRLNPAQTTPNWDEITPGKGGYVDAPTSDVIIGAQALQDQIVVFFSNSTWVILPTSDPALPFRWKRINNFRTSNASYAQVAYDQFITSFGERGIYACDGTSAKRIDEKISEFVVENVNLDEIDKVYSERDFVRRKSWTLFPSSDIVNSGTDATTSDLALIRMDEDGSFATFTTSVIDDAGNLQNMSVIGHGSADEDYTFADFNGVTLPDYSWGEFGEENFLSFFMQGEAEILLGGDQVGRIFQMETGANDNGENIEMEIESAAWAPFREQGVLAQFGWMDIYADADYNAKLDLDFYKDDDEYPYFSTSTYLLPKVGFLADIQSISNANPCVIGSHEHGLPNGQRVYIYALNGMEELTGGPYTITLIDANYFSLNGVDSSAYSAYIDGGKVCENLFTNTKCWKRVYAGGTGYNHFVVIKSSGKNHIVNLHAFMPYFRPTGTRMTQ